MCVRGVDSWERSWRGVRYKAQLLGALLPVLEPVKVRPALETPSVS